MIARATLLASVILCAAFNAAQAVEPVGAADFNIKTDIDLKGLDTANFFDVLTPKAKEEGTIVFYDFGESEKELFAEIIRRFETKYDGVKVDYHQVDGEQAVQQLIAAKQAGQPSPVDIFWMPNGQVRVANEAGVIANLPLNTMLPSAPDVAENPATVSRGYVHGGVVAPFHRNQTAIGFDTRTVALGTEPKSFPELLAFAKANPMKVAITNPTKGGSGQRLPRDRDPRHDHRGLPDAALRLYADAGGSGCVGGRPLHRPGHRLLQRAQALGRVHQRQFRHAQPHRERPGGRRDGLGGHGVRLHRPRASAAADQGAAPDRRRGRRRRRRHDPLGRASISPARCSSWTT